MPLAPRTRVLLALLLTALGFGMALLVAPYQIDDSFITYHYAQNLVTAGELSFNRGEAPVEGFSSPAWLLLLSALAWVSSPDSLPLFGVLLGLLSLAAVFFLAWRILADPFRPLLPLALLALNPGISFYAVTGLEPLLFLAVVLAAFGASAGRLPLSWGLFACGIALWVRPESAVLPGLFVVGSLGRGEWRSALCRRFWTLTAALFAGAVLLLLVRLLLFRQFLPNTYFAKLPDWKDGVAYCLETLSSPSSLVVVVLGLAGGLLGKSLYRGFLCVAMAWIFIVILEGGDWMPMGRMLLPTFAFFAFAAGGLVDPQDRASRFLTRPTARRAYGAFLTLACALAVMISLREGLASAYVAERSHLREGQETDRILDWVEASGARSVGLMDIGRLGFFTQVEVFDFAGLTDARIAHAPGGLMKKKFDLDYLYVERRPEVLILRFTEPPQMAEDGTPRFHPGTVGSPVEQHILLDDRLTALYRQHLVILPGYERDPYSAKLLLIAQDFKPKAKAADLLPPPSADGVSVLYLSDPAPY